MVCSYLLVCFCFGCLVWFHLVLLWFVIFVLFVAGIICCVIHIGVDVAFGLFVIGHVVIVVAVVAVSVFVMLVITVTDVPVGVVIVLVVPLVLSVAVLR